MTIFGATYQPDDISPVLEKFVGNNRNEFRVIESELGKIIAEVHKKYKPINGGGSAFKNPDVISINNGDSNKLIQRHIMKIFGFKDFNLIWTYSGQLRAVTAPRAITFLSKGPNDKGEYSNPKLTPTVVIDLSLIVYCDMTNEELLAIILHEVGHSFYSSIFQLLMFIPMNVADVMNIMSSADKASVYRILQGFMSSIVTSHVGSVLLAATTHITNALKSAFPPLAKFINGMGELSTNVRRMSTATERVVQIILAKGKMSNPLHFISARSVFGYNAEKFSDSFAVDYGYGVQLAKALDKIDNVPNAIENSMDSKLSWAIDLINVPWEIAHRLTGEHPDMQNRIRTGLDRLKRASQDPDLPEVLRKQIDTQIDEYEKFYKFYLSVDNDNNQRRIFTWLSRIATEKFFKGKLDLREFTYALDPKKYR